MSDDEYKYSVDRKRRCCCICCCPPEAILNLSLHDRLHHLTALMHLPVPEHLLGNACLYENLAFGHLCLGSLGLCYVGAGSIKSDV
jgi:hypothetical protein